MFDLYRRAIIFFLEMQYSYEQTLIERATLHVQKQIQHRPKNLYSAFNDKLDHKLEELVVDYCFDFEAIALHLTYQFPQFEYKISPKAIGYRWAQIQHDRKHPSYYEQQEPKRKKSGGCLELDDEIEEDNEDYLPNYKKKGSESTLCSHPGSHYMLAMQQAQQLDDEENETFILYKPKFSSENEYKLEREEIHDDINKLSTMLENQPMEFGFFEGKSESAIAAAVPLEVPNIELKKIEGIEEDYQFDPYLPPAELPVTLLELDDQIYDSD